MRRYRKALISLVIGALLFSAPGGIPADSPAEAADLDDGLILHYPFDDASDSRTVRDASGNGHHGTLAGDARIVADPQRGGAVELDGDRDYVEMPSGLLQGLTDATIAAWVYMDAQKNWASLFSFGNHQGLASPHQRIVLNYAPKSNVNTSELELIRGDFAEFNTITGTPLPTGQWKHVTVVLSGTENRMYLYVDGLRVGTWANFPIRAGDIEDLYNYIGWAQFEWEQTPGKGLDGKVADFRIYNRALGIGEIKTLAGADAAIVSIDEVQVITVAGQAPQLPDRVTVRYADGLGEPKPVIWDAIDESAYAVAGEFVAEGTVEGTSLRAVARVTVLASKEIVSVALVQVATTPGKAPELPAQVTVTYNDNTTALADVEWDPIDPEQYAEGGVTFTVEGSVAGTSIRAVATVRVNHDDPLLSELVAWYTFTEMNGTTIPDASGNGRDATAVGGPVIVEVDGKRGLDLDASRQQHVVMPAGILSELNQDFSILMWVYVDVRTSEGLGNWRRLFDFGVGDNQGRVFMTYNLYFDMTGRIADGTPMAPPVGRWTHVAVTKTGNLFTIYSNGVVAATGNSTKTPADYGVTTRNFIGRSNWPADPYLDGKVKDFRIYRIGLTAEQVREVMNQSVTEQDFTDEEAVAITKANLTLGDTSRVVSDLTLPTVGLYGATISWSSSHPEVVGPDGTVNRPGQGEEDAIVVLTATITRGNHSDTKKFVVVVLANNVESIEDVHVTTLPNFYPKLPKTVKVRYPGGVEAETEVRWEPVPMEELDEPGKTVQVFGTVFGTDMKAVAHVTAAEIVRVDEPVVYTALGKAPELPSTVTIHYSNGATGQAEVKWEPVSGEAYQEPGTFTVNGKASIYSYTNPLIEQRADPYIYKHTDGYYYFTASVPEYDRIVLRRATTIEGLAHAEEKTIWTKHPSGEMSAHIWAPELHYIDGKWYIYFAAGGLNGDIWNIRPYVLENDSANPLEGTWVEKGMMQQIGGTGAFTDFSLDATTFEHRGTRYLVWAEKRAGISNLYIAEMENPWTIRGNAVLIATPDYEWERRGFWVNEGPAVLKRNGKIFIAYSASATDANYAIGLLTADEDADLLNPSSWRKHPEPVLASNDATGQYGPGHNSFTVAEDGVTDLLVYHARNYKEIVGDPLYDPNRHTRVKRLDWKEDGTPDFGIAEPDGTAPGPAIPVTVRVHVLESFGLSAQTAFNLPQLAPDALLTAYTVLTNTTGEAKDVVVALALYDGNMRMVRLESKPISVPANGSGEAFIGMRLPSNVAGHKAKLFVWEGTSLQESDAVPLWKAEVLH